MACEHRRIFGRRQSQTEKQLLFEWREATKGNSSVLTCEDVNEVRGN